MFCLIENGNYWYNISGYTSIALPHCNSLARLYTWYFYHVGVPIGINPTKTVHSTRKDIDILVYSTHLRILLNFKSFSCMLVQDGGEMWRY